MKSVRHLAAFLLIMVLGATVAFALGKGDKAPDFKLSTIAGKTVSLSGLRQGTTKLILLDFWATNCPPCVAEVPHIQRLYQKYSKQGLMVVGVSGYRGDTVEDVKAFAKDNKMTYPIPYDANASVGRQYGIWGLPMLFVIDKSGTIRNVHMGYTAPEALEKDIKTFLK